MLADLSGSLENRCPELGIDIRTEAARTKGPTGLIASFRKQGAGVDNA